MTKTSRSTLRRLAMCLLAAVMALALTACGDTLGPPPTTQSTAPAPAPAPAPTPTPTPAPAPSQALPFIFELYADYSAGTDYIVAQELGVIFTSERSAPAEPTLLELADHLSEWTGLDFALNDVYTDGTEVWVDWSPTSTLLAGPAGREFKKDFTFHDSVTLNWFMLDSLYRTILYYAPSSPYNTVYYSWGGGNPLSFPEMQGLEELPLDQPYYGSAYYTALYPPNPAQPPSHYVYEDSEYGVVLYYPDAFESLGYVNANGEMAFPLVADSRTTLRYWVVNNVYGETIGELMARTPAEDATEYTDGTAVGYGSEVNQMTGEVSDHAYFFLVDADHIFVVYITCQDLAEAAEWYQVLLEGGIFIEYANG
ncbi:MAG: hypothetical protein AB7V55_06525 [Oscillospiraceae bacterium]